MAELKIPQDSPPAQAAARFAGNELSHVAKQPENFSAQFCPFNVASWQHETNGGHSLIVFVFYCRDWREFQKEYPEDTKISWYLPINQRDSTMIPRIDGRIFRAAPWDCEDGHSNGLIEVVVALSSKVLWVNREEMLVNDCFVDCPYPLTEWDTDNRGFLKLRAILRDFDLISDYPEGSYVRWKLPANRTTIIQSGGETLEVALHAEITGRLISYEDYCLRVGHESEMTIFIEPDNEIVFDRLGKSVAPPDDGRGPNTGN